MNERVVFDTAPRVVDWALHLSDAGWKLIESEEQFLRAKRKFGECEYPPAHETTWYLTVKEDGEGGIGVEVTVPTFAESPSASERVLDTLSDITTELDGECHTDRELTVDVLAWLREQHDAE